VLLPAGRRLASRRSIQPGDIAGGPCINLPKSYAPALRRVIDDALAHSGVRPTCAHEAETLPAVISLLLLTGGISLLPAWPQ
jgi:hypothetical protein